MIMTAPELTPEWMPIDEFCVKYEQSPGVIAKRAHDGVWERGVIYASPTGRGGYIHEERARAWLEERGKLPLPPLEDEAPAA